MDAQKRRKAIERMSTAIKEAATPKKDGHPASHYCYVENELDPGSWDGLMFADNGKPDPEKLGRLYAAYGPQRTPAERRERMGAALDQAQKRIEAAAASVGMDIATLKERSGAGDFWVWIQKVASQGHPVRL